MDDKKSELLQYAREYAAAGKDLYELLSVAGDAAQPEVHRAWRKASLKHHPDKAKHFDPEIWQLFERARDVLSSPDARAAYDSARAAAVQAQKARAALDAKRRAMIDDLEARERGVKRKADTGGNNMMAEAEKRVLMEKGKELLEKRRRMREEAEARERERERERMAMEIDDNSNDAARDGAEKQSMQPDATSTSTDNKTGDPDVHPQPQPSAPADEYDERIAEIERRLRERKAGKAARKADKKKKDSHSHRHNNNNNNKDEVTEDRSRPATTTTSPPPPTTATTAATIPITNAATAQKPYPASNTGGTGDFASTMAKLRAAQREKERKKAEAEAAATPLTSDSR